MIASMQVWANVMDDSIYLSGGQLIDSPISSETAVIISTRPVGFPYTYLLGVKPLLFLPFGDVRPGNSVIDSTGFVGTVVGWIYIFALIENRLKRLE